MVSRMCIHKLWSHPANMDSEGRVRDIDACEVALLKNRYFKDLSHLYVVSLPSKDDQVLLLHGYHFRVYQKCLKCGLQFLLSPFECECLNYFSLSPGRLMPNIRLLLLAFEALCLSSWQSLTALLMLCFSTSVQRTITRYHSPRGESCYLVGWKYPLSIRRTILSLQR